MQRLLLAACWLVSVVSCATVNVSSPPLPERQAISCCWLIQESVSLVDSNGEHHFTTALAVEHNSQVLVLFDVLGNKILSSQRQAGSILVDIDKSAGKIPVTLLWSAIYLLHAPVSQWPQTNKRWRVIDNNGTRTMYHNGKPWATVRPEKSEHGLSGATIDFPARNITLSVTGIEKQAL